MTGIAAGVLYHDGWVYATIAPDLQQRVELAGLLEHRETVRVRQAHVEDHHLGADRTHLLQALGAGAIGYQLKDATPQEIESAIRAAASKSGRASSGWPVAVSSSPRKIRIQISR